MIYLKFKIMFFSLNSIKKPKRTFNLLHLETSETYLLSLKVSMHINMKYDEYGDERE